MELFSCVNHKYVNSEEEKLPLWNWTTICPDTYSLTIAVRGLELECAAANHCFFPPSCRNKGWVKATEACVICFIQFTRGISTWWTEATTEQSPVCARARVLDLNKSLCDRPAVVSSSWLVSSTCNSLLLTHCPSFSCLSLFLYPGPAWRAAGHDHGALAYTLLFNSRVLDCEYWGGGVILEYKV